MPRRWLLKAQEESRTSNGSLFSHSFCSVIYGDAVFSQLRTNRRRLIVPRFYFRKAACFVQGAQNCLRRRNKNAGKLPKHLGGGEGVGVDAIDYLLSVTK